jgi:superfamily II RNA helicase
VPLEFVYRETPIHETIEHLLETGAAPIYLVNFTQRACAEQAQSLTSINVCTKQEKRLIAKELEGVELDTPYGKKFRRFVSHGIGIHHGGLLPKYRRVVERLSQTGLIKVISGTDTLGVGVNIPIRTVLFSQLYKYDGEKTAILPARDFHQVAGRAGRKGFDDEGLVVAQAPEWTIENRRNQAKIQKKPHLKKKLRRKGPPRGAVHWNEGHFRKLVESPPEPLDSQLEIDHGMLVNVLQSAPESRAGGYRRLMDIISRAHISSSEKSSQRRRAASLFRSLRQAGVVEVVRKDPQKPPRPRVQENLQENFSLYQALSLYLIETIDHLDPDNESFALDLLTLVESILEDPRVVLYRQVDKIKDELIARLKAEGVDYEDRIAELEKVEHPKPNADLIYMTFNEFADSHPWVGHENIRPKSVAREMFERCATFNDYVRDYGLGRSEGVLLRYLTQVYKTAVQNVPEPAWTEDFQDVLAYLHGLVRRTDDSLIREWRLLASNPEVSLTPASPPAAAETEARAEKKTPSAADLLEDPRAFRARVRNELHVLLKALADSQFEEACETIHHSEQHTWDPDALQEATAPCLEEYGELDVTPRARQSRNTIFIQEGDRTFTVQQKLIGPGDEDDWMLDCRVDLTDDRDPAKPLIELRRIGV